MGIKEICQQVPVIPVLVVEELQQAKPMAEALVKGGLHVLEVTLRTPVALDAIRVMSEVEGSVVGAGTVLNAADVKAVKAAGAAFAVSPGATPELVAAAREYDLPLLPGAATASEVMRLMEQGFDFLKFFPAEAAGGIPMLKSLYGPLAAVSFCPTGGVSPANARDYLSLPNIVCVGGSWVTPKALVAAGEWDKITELARECSQLRG
ncbi:MAG: bifunctional 4-hydroxy-2-oxoglutarate aldolase/2-dehydro-3-deoxy-phosphogluconate aldolase [Thiolinea sp.]